MKAHFTLYKFTNQMTRACWRAARWLLLKEETQGDPQTLSSAQIYQPTPICVEVL